MATEARNGEYRVRERMEPYIEDLKSRIQTAKEELWSCHNEYLSREAKKAEKNLQEREEDKQRQMDAAWGEYEDIWGARPH